MKYKISCEFYIEAKNEDEVHEYLKEEAGLDFEESHLIVEKATEKEAKENGDYVDLPSYD